MDLCCGKEHDPDRQDRANESLYAPSFVLQYNASSSSSLQKVGYEYTPNKSTPHSFLGIPCNDPTSKKNGCGKGLMSEYILMMKTNPCTLVFCSIECHKTRIITTTNQNEGRH